MLFHETPINGAFVLEPQRIRDDRGFFARLWCADEMSKQGLSTTIRQTNIGVSIRKGTLRGLHYQREPHAEVKIVRCPRGAIFDVVVDLRPASPTFCRWHGVELSQANQLALYVPEGCATGYLTLTMTARSITTPAPPITRPAPPASATTILPSALSGPATPEVMSEQDRTWPDFEKSQGRAS
jgi:dTDP-4-dehydrorhamnose 3,5-epimerase